MNSSTAIINQFTKESIKLRMMQHATNLWGVKHPNSLDPFVKLLIEAFSTEIFRAANETQNIESRILDKIAHMLTPNLLTTAKPAHAVMQAQPTRPEYLIHPHTKFSIQKKMIHGVIDKIKQDDIQINFSPTQSSKLIKGKIAYLANSYQVFGIDDSGFKYPLLRTATPLPWASCWLGIKLDAEVNNLDQVSLYFDFPSYHTNNWIYSLLPLCRIFYDGIELKLRPGRLSYEEEDTVRQSSKELFQNHDILKQLHDEVNQYYNQKFLTIETCELDRSIKGYPDILVQHFDSTLLMGKVPDNIVWLQVLFPPNYNYEMLSNSLIAINCFPVSNRNLITSFYSYKGLNNILPLRTDAQNRLLSVHQVMDVSGREFSEIPFNHSSKTHGGFYSIRHGGVERFDQRSAYDMVTYLLELTRDEVAAFSSLDQTFIRTSLESLARQLKQIENKTQSLDKFVKQSPSYLVVEPIDPDENIQVSYWVTQDIEANQIRQGTQFKCLNNPSIEPQSGVLMNESSGGREPLQAGERLNMYRYALGSRNRLITIEDIRNFCKVELGQKIREVTFSKGLALSPHPKQGYIRTVDIGLVPQNIHEFNREEWDHIAHSLLIKIQSLSPDGTNYRIKVAS